MAQEWKRKTYRARRGIIPPCVVVPNYSELTPKEMAEIDLRYLEEYQKDPFTAKLRVIAGLVRNYINGYKNA